MIENSNKHLPENIQILIQEFSKFPGVGPKTAEKYIFYLLNHSDNYLTNLAGQIAKLADSVNLCPRCYNFTAKANEDCSICRDPNRSGKNICVVAKQQDLMAMEALHEYKGHYHVLQGIINPIEGLTPDKLTIKKLLERIETDKPEEIILALDADMNGETTILYLQKILKDKNIKLSRLARGIPIGATLEYADEATLANALKGRKEI